MSQIRPIAICIFRRNDHILVAEGYDPVKDEYFYRPLGGGIEFGENSVQAISREVMEEINVEVDRESLKHLATLENIFHFNGSLGHEIVFIYDGVLKDAALYEQDLIRGKEANGEEIRALWKSLGDFGDRKLILYPAGLLALLR